MKVGISTFVTDKTMRPDVLGKAVEDRGFESLFLPEHSHIPASRDTPYPFGDVLPDPYFRGWDPLIAVAAAALATSTLCVGTGVMLLAQRDAIQVAKEVACLDILSNGRLILGLGCGWNIEEMHNHGVDPVERGSLLDEKIEVLKEIWGRDKAEFHGHHIDFEPIFQWPKPVQSPHPPIYIGGWSQAALSRASRLGDGWMPIAASKPDGVYQQVERAKSIGRPDLPLTVLMTACDPELLAAYDEADVKRITLFLPVKEENEALRRLDQLAEVADQCGLLRR